MELNVIQRKRSVKMNSNILADNGERKKVTSIEMKFAQQRAKNTEKKNREQESKERQNFPVPVFTWLCAVLLSECDTDICSERRDESL